MAGAALLVVFAVELATGPRARPLSGRTVPRGHGDHRRRQREHQWLARRLTTAQLSGRV